MFYSYVQLINKQNTCIILRIEIMQRVFATIHALYEELVLKHCYSKKNNVTKRFKFLDIYAYIEIKCDFGVFEI